MSQYEQSGTKKPTQEKRDMTWREFAVAIVAIGAVLVIVNFWRVKRFYFENYENIWLSAYVLFVFISAFAYYQFQKKTKALQAHVKRLKPLWNPEVGILAGQSTEQKVNLYVPDEARLGHVQILAATGKGKTVSVIEPWLIRDVKKGRSAILIDGKGDPGLVTSIRKAVTHLGLPHRISVFDLGNPNTSATTNPLAHGSPQQITDRLFTAFTFEDPFYRSVQYRVAGMLTALLNEGNQGPITFKRIYDCLVSDDCLSRAIQATKTPDFVAQATRFLNQDRKEREKQMAGLVAQIEPLAAGEVAALLNGEVEGKEHQTLSDAIMHPEIPQILIFLIPTLKYQAIGHQLGKFLFQELAWAIGERSSHGATEYPFTPVYLDEFSAFVYEGFHQILNKARSSKVALHLSHQSIGDFSIVSPELATVFNTNTNVKCLLGLNDPDTADFFARHLGTEKEEKLTSRGTESGWFKSREKTGDVSIREVEAYRIHPNRLKNYSRGMGVIHLPTDGGNVTEEIQFQCLSPEDLQSEEVAS